MFLVLSLKCILLLLFSSHIPVFGENQQCMTPLGVPGYVVFIDECGPLHDLNRNDQKTDKELLYLQQSIYNVTSDFQFNVCCPSKSKWSNTIDFQPIKYPESDETKPIDDYKTEYDDDKASDGIIYTLFPDCKRTVQPPEPSSFCCGGARVSISETARGPVYVSGFPWLALLEYSEGQQLCGGSLISMKFVLSAAHCFTSSYGAPELVHLGQYNRSDPSKTAKTAAIPIEQYYIHPKYNKEKHIHDIALIKLLRFAPYTDAITPICLPTLDVLVSGVPYPGNFAVAGFGTTEMGDFAPVKLFTAVPLVNHTVCSDHHFYEILPEQICAGGGTGDSCGGDSGGPLEMFEQDLYLYTLAGVVSYGARHCAQIGNPAVYTNVYKYKDWIKNVTRS